MSGTSELPAPVEPGGPAARATLTEPVPAPLGIFDPHLLAACISCGFCLPVCPTYAQTKAEADSPRGRITLMRALEDGRLDPDDPTLQHEAGLCLGCRACETVCPAGVKYGELLEQWRDHQWRGRHTPLVAGGLRAGVRVTAALAAGGLVRGAARTTGPADPSRPHIMLGCMERSLYPGISKAVLRLVPDADVPSGQGCCGALHAHNGGSVEGARLAAALGQAMPGTIVSTSGGCAAYLDHQLGHGRVAELSQFLVARWAADPSSKPRLRKILVDGRVARIGLQDSCQLRNGMGVSAQPRALLREIGEFGRIFRDRGFLRFLPAVMVLSALNFTFQGLWAGPWLRDVAGLDAGTRSVALLIYATGLVSGNLVTGHAASFTQARGYSPMFIPYLGIAGVLVAQFALILSPSGFWPVAGVWFLFSFCGSVGIAGYSAMGQGFPAELQGRVATAINFAMLVLVFILQTGIGAILDLWPRLPDGGWNPAGYAAALAVTFLLQAGAALWIVLAPRGKAA